MMKLLIFAFLLVSVTLGQRSLASNPVARFTYTENGLNVTFDGRSSTASSGTITKHSWNFGDHYTGVDAVITRTYAKAGTYTVTLTVTDSSGRTNSLSKVVTVKQPVAKSEPPIAKFTSTANGLTVNFDGTGSSDPEGTISTYSWNFGESTSKNDTATGSKVSHTYAKAGTYTVTLTVENTQDQTNSTTQKVTVSVPFVASFTVSPVGSPNNREFVVDASASQGQISSYYYDLGDGTIAGPFTNINESQLITYSQSDDAGMYSLTLFIRSASGKTASAQKEVTLTAPPEETQPKTEPESSQ